MSAGSSSAGDCPFWSFSVALYGRPGVAPACLALQDRFGCDVNLLLFAIWAGRCGVMLGPKEFERLDA
ncbi:MAG TPA: TIGR02444 family protein, partial [Alphaproteobacteria bacterium]